MGGLLNWRILIPAGIDPFRYLPSVLSLSFHMVGCLAALATSQRQGFQLEEQGTFGALVRLISSTFQLRLQLISYGFNADGFGTFSANIYGSNSRRLTFGDLTSFSLPLCLQAIRRVWHSVFQMQKKYRESLSQLNIFA